MEGVDQSGLVALGEWATSWMQWRGLSKYEACSNHLLDLHVSENSTVKGADWAKLHGYCRQWTDTKYVLGCAMFIDILTPSAIFSKVMQSDELDILDSLTSLLWTIKEPEKLRSLPLTQWPVYSATLKNVKVGKWCISARNLSSSVRQWSTITGTTEFCTQVIACLCSRVAWSDQGVIVTSSAFWQFKDGRRSRKMKHLST